ncbi:MAG: DUF4833 domain-containing protein [Bacteroidetes bacterium]|nr:DUF4833 domain-containing protein [Bacteroidota bacterium]
MKIGRSIDKNEIHYFIQLDKDGLLLKNNPIELYWINNEDKGQVESINWIKKKFGYGLKYLKNEKQEAVFHFVSYPKRQLMVKKSLSGDYKIFTASNGLTVEISSIFIHIDGGTFWLPNVTKVELHAMDINSKKSIIEIIYP